MKKTDEAIQRVFDAAKRDGGINTSDGIRALIDATFTVARNADEFDTDRDCINAFALLSGMATAALLDYAKRLEEEGQ